MVCLGIVSFSLFIGILGVGGFLVVVFCIVNWGVMCSRLGLSFCEVLVLG